MFCTNLAYDLATIPVRGVVRKDVYVGSERTDNDAGTRIPRPVAPRCVKNWGWEERIGYGMSI